MFAVEYLKLLQLKYAAGCHDGRVGCVVESVEEELIAAATNNLVIIVGAWCAVALRCGWRLVCVRPLIRGWRQYYPSARQSAPSFARLRAEPLRRAPRAAPYKSLYLSKRGWVTRAPVPSLNCQEVFVGSVGLVVFKQTATTTSKHDRFGHCERERCPSKMLVKEVDHRGRD